MVPQDYQTAVSTYYKKTLLIIVQNYPHQMDKISTNTNITQNIHAQTPNTHFQRVSCNKRVKIYVTCDHANFELFNIIFVCKGNSFFYLKEFTEVLSEKNLMLKFLPSTETCHPSPLNICQSMKAILCVHVWWLLLRVRGFWESV